MLTEEHLNLVVKSRTFPPHNFVVQADYFINVQKLDDTFRNVGFYYFLTEYRDIHKVTHCQNTSHLLRCETGYNLHNKSSSWLPHLFMVDCRQCFLCKVHIVSFKSSPFSSTYRIFVHFCWNPCLVPRQSIMDCPFYPWSPQGHFVFIVLIQVCHLWLFRPQTMLKANNRVV